MKREMGKGSTGRNLKEGHEEKKLGEERSCRRERGISRATRREKLN